VERETAAGNAAADDDSASRRAHNDLSLINRIPLDAQSGIVYDVAMNVPQIVLDTNVLIAGLRSRNGASFRILQLLEKEVFEIHLSVPLVFEYEDVAKGLAKEISLTKRDVDDFLDYLCQIANLHEIFFLWRPFLKDPKDDMVLELAVTARCQYIVTFNIADFSGIQQFGIRAVKPRDFLRVIGELQ
jgi:putative PIN family toxin of toxin-antitoxin system